MTNAVLKEPVLDQKRVTISSKRQFTIPQKYYAQVGFGKEAECLLTRDAIIIRPLASNQGGELAESILADLIAQGGTPGSLPEKTGPSGSCRKGHAF